MSSTEVSELLAALRAGRLAWMTWLTASGIDPGRCAPGLTPADYAEMAERKIPSRDVPGSFDEVTAAYDRGELTRDQYRTLAARGGCGDQC